MTQKLRPYQSLTNTTDAPSTLRASQAWPTASHGDGMSKKTASATWTTPKPLRHTSWVCTVTHWLTRCSWNSSRALSARCWWNSTVCRWPVGAILRMIAWDTEPLPVPGRRSKKEGTLEDHTPPSTAPPLLQQEKGVHDRHMRVETVSHHELHVCSGSLSLGFGMLGLELMGCAVLTQVGTGQPYPAHTQNRRET